MSDADLVTLRVGEAGRSPVFLFPGAGGAADELAPLVAALPPGREVVGFEGYAPGPDRSGDIADVAERAAGAIRARQPQGPYRLVGFSFGGLVALETARRLEAAGSELAFVGLIDAVYDRRYWPFGLFVAGTAARTVGHLRRLARGPLSAALPELATRAGALGRRLANRAAPSAPAAAVARPATSSKARAHDAVPRYIPQPAALRVSYFASRAGGDFGIDPSALWRRLLPNLDVHRLDAVHLELVREPAAIALLAAELDAALAAAEARVAA